MRAVQQKVKQGRTALDICRTCNAPQGGPLAKLLEAAMKPKAKWTMLDTRRQKQSLRLIVAVGTLACCLASPVAPARAGGASDQKFQKPRVWKVLIIGNSYTYFNNLPKMFEQVALADRPPRQVRCEMIVKGGATLQQHWDEGKAVPAIRQGGWDFVIVQEQSTLGVTFIVEGQPRIDDASYYFAAARRFDDVIRKSGARTVVFAFWARETAPKEDHDALAYDHFKLGKELGAIVAPVGLAWQAVRKQKAHPTLYHDDHSHPMPEGSYLAACTLYAACFGAVPAQPPLTVNARPINVNGQASSDKAQTLLQLSPELARAFHEAVNEGLASGRQFVRELEQHKPALTPQLPHLERGRRPTIEELLGEWVGDRTMGRRVTMTLRLTRSGDSLQASAKLSLGGKSPDIILQIGDFQITGEGVSFVDRNKEPNGGGVARYRGAYTGQTLKGIAEISLKEERLYVIGSWQLRKSTPAKSGG